ncbi:transglycosylase family protein [Streptomyces sp. NPDC048002]|uniref:transglycosylase family protein n=1 Tax=Streptomyces sp. NPDC048002 TaxID=3154344 RepID=UPI0033E26BC1
MLSGNGRHRRPRQAPALIVAAGVTGSAIAIPLLGATGASAAEGTTWDRVAECESGGSWSEDSGNGYYGGLQVTQENWEEYGGKAYAASPDRASRSQQIAVAERILADQGLAAWPTCGPLSGLDAESGSVGIDTGLEEDGNSSDSSESSNSSSSSGLLDAIGGGASESPSDSGSDDSGSEASATPGASDEASDEASDSATSEKPSKADKSTESARASESGKSKGAPGSSGSSDSSQSDPSREVDSLFTGISGLDNSDSILWVGGDSALVDTGAGRHRGQPADERGADDTYVVRAGDTLASIADSLDLDGGWRGLYAANESAIGPDPSRITPGQTLEVRD